MLHGTIRIFRTVIACFIPFLGALEAHAFDCQLRQESAALRLENCHNLSVLTLRGSPAERAHAFGELLKNNQLDPALVRFFAGRATKEMEHLPKPILWLAEKLRNQLAHYLFRSVDPIWREELHQMAVGMGVEDSYLESAAVLPDLSSWINAFAEKWPLTSLPPLGCTSVAKLAGPTAFYYGRNLDFASTGIWDKHPMVLVHLPPSGSSELRHIAFGSHGVFFAGITGVNEAGITLSIHQNFASERSKGVPMFLLGEMLLREAHTLEEAIAFLEKHRPGPIWTYVLTDLKTGAAAAVELSAKHFFVRRMQGSEFVQSNHLAGPDLAALEFIRPAILENSRFRAAKALEILQSDPNAAFDPKQIFAVLSHVSEASGEIASFQDILKPHTIQTLVFASVPGQNPFDSRVHLSDGEAPASTGTFLEFRLGDFFETTPGKPTHFEGRPVLDPKSPVRKNQMAVARAFRLYFDERNIEAAIAEVKNQTSLGARLFLSTAYYQTENYEAAWKILQEAEKDPLLAKLPLPLRDGFSKVRILTAAAAGKAEAAASASQAAIQQGTDDPMLLEIASHVANGKAIPWRLRKISYDFFSGNLRTMPKRK